MSRVLPLIYRAGASEYFSHSKPEEPKAITLENEEKIKYRGLDIINKPARELTRTERGYHALAEYYAGQIFNSTKGKIDIGKVSFVNLKAAMSYLQAMSLPVRALDDEINVQEMFEKQFLYVINLKHGIEKLKSPLDKTNELLTEAYDLLHITTEYAADNPEVCTWMTLGKKNKMLEQITSTRGKIGTYLSGAHDYFPHQIIISMIEQELTDEIDPLPNVDDFAEMSDMILTPAESLFYMLQENKESAKNWMFQKRYVIEYKEAIDKHPAANPSSIKELEEQYDISKNHMYDSSRTIQYHISPSLFQTEEIEYAAPFICGQIDKAAKDDSMRMVVAAPEMEKFLDIIYNNDCSMAYDTLIGTALVPAIEEYNGGDGTKLNNIIVTALNWEEQYEGTGPGVAYMTCLCYNDEIEYDGAKHVFQFPPSNMWGTTDNPIHQALCSYLQIGTIEAIKSLVYLETAFDYDGNSYDKKFLDEVKDSPYFFNYVNVSNIMQWTEANFGSMVASKCAWDINTFNFLALCHRELGADENKLALIQKFFDRPNMTIALPPETSAQIVKSYSTIPKWLSRLMDIYEAQLSEDNDLDDELLSTVLKRDESLIEPFLEPFLDAVEPYVKRKDWEGFHQFTEDFKHQLFAEPINEVFKFLDEHNNKLSKTEVEANKGETKKTPESKTSLKGARARAAKRMEQMKLADNVLFTEDKEEPEEIDI